MSTSFAQSAIALLIDLAERGEIDPWDVQVIDVFDRCLTELAAQNQQDLSHSGQAFLCASMLVLLKSDSLEIVTVEEAEDGVAELLEDLPLPPEAKIPLHPEKYLHRRAAAPPPQKRRVTLVELISHLELIAATLEQPQPQRSRRAQRPGRTPSSLKAITQLAHQENLVEIATEVEHFLSQYWLNFSSSEATEPEWLALETLLEHKQDRVGVFWALLYLCSQSKVELCQTQFYQDLKLRPLLDRVGVA